MFVLSYLRQGLGNKLFHFATILYFYLELRKRNKAFTHLYIAEAQSRHQEDVSKERFNVLFPNIEKYKWIKFISMKEFDELKKDCVFVEQKDKRFPISKNILYKPDYNFTKVPFVAYSNLLRKMLYFKPSLEYKYDFDNDIFLHMRYGDKFNTIIQKGKLTHVVLTPEYYFEALLLLRDKEVRNVYIFTDSKDLIEKVYIPEFRKMKEFNFIISNEPYWNVFYLAQKFKKIITSESTLIYSGLLLNENYTTVIAFPYMIANSRVNKSKLSLQRLAILKDDFTLLDDKRYILTGDFFRKSRY